MADKQDRIEQINRRIVALMLNRARAARRNNWPEEQRVQSEIDKLEQQIKQIEAEYV